MGGALALYSGFHVNRNVRGIFTCSSFLNDNSVVYDTLKSLPDDEKLKLPKLLMFHGERDTLVPPDWGLETFNQLKSCGVDGDWRILKNAMHEIKANQLNEVHEWITELLPPLDTDKSEN